jgi:hypothetical protein
MARPGVWVRIVQMLDEGGSSLGRRKFEHRDALDSELRATPMG